MDVRWLEAALVDVVEGEGLGGVGTVLVHLHRPTRRSAPLLLLLLLPAGRHDLRQSERHVNTTRRRGGGWGAGGRVCCYLAEQGGAGEALGTGLGLVGGGGGGTGWGVPGPGRPLVLSVFLTWLAPGLDALIASYPCSSSSKVLTGHLLEERVDILVALELSVGKMYM